MSWNIAPLAIGKCYDEVDENGAVVKGLGDLQSVDAPGWARSNAGPGGTHKTFTFRFGTLYGSTPTVVRKVKEVPCPAYWPNRSAGSQRGGAEPSEGDGKCYAKNDEWNGKPVEKYLGKFLGVAPPSGRSWTGGPAPTTYLFEKGHVFAGGVYGTTLSDVVFEVPCQAGGRRMNRKSRKNRKANRKSRKNRRNNW